MALQPFQWLGTQAISTPEQAARQRSIAEALIAQSATPADNWASGLGDIAAALSGTILNNRVSEAETAGRERAGELFTNLAVNQDPNSIIAALTSNDAAWASPAQTSIASALLNSGLERQDPMYQLRLQQAQAELDNTLAGSSGDERFFGNVIPMQDENGNIVLGQASNMGTWQPLQGAEGFTPAPTTKQIDTGTEIITTDIYGNELYRTPKQNFQEAADRAAGTATGEFTANAELSAPGQIANADTALDLINQIKTSPELDWATGTAAGLGANAIPGTGRYGFQNLVEQAKSGAFLTAIQEMKGLGALSNAEGQAATQAITRINTGLSKQDFLKALEDYQRIVERGRDRAARRVQVDDSGRETPVAGTSAPQDQGWQDVGNGVRIRPIGN